MNQIRLVLSPALSTSGAAAGVRSTSVQDVMRRLLQRKNVMVRPPGPAAAIREAKYIASIDILQVCIRDFRSNAHKDAMMRPPGPTSAVTEDDCTAAIRQVSLLGSTQSLLCLPRCLLASPDSSH